jgi:uncharacterized protein YndB with AHSA1/START domain
MPSATDRIEQQAVIAAPRNRVWRAVGDAEEFGRWFRAELAGQRFEPGHRTRGHITYPGYEHLVFDVLVDRVEPERLLSFRWHPHPVDPSLDYSKEVPTQVTFELKDAPGGTLLSVVESGFDRIPDERRADAYEANTGGWEIQMDNIREHLAG